MNLSDLRPASQFSNSTGFKCIVFGAPGSGKTPIAATCPQPVMLVTEPGMLSMRGSNIPAYEAYDAKSINSFFEWWFSSNETKQFETLILDSVSQLCDIYLQQALKTNKHGLAAYGEMGEEVMKKLRPLFFQPKKHCYLISKQIVDDGVKKPYYPGKFLPVEIPHLYDAILHLGIHNVPQVGQVLSFQCKQSIDIIARDRSGRLNEFEEPNFTNVVRKAMS